MKLPTKAEGRVVASEKNTRGREASPKVVTPFIPCPPSQKLLSRVFFFRGEGGLLETCCLAHFCFACALFLFVQKRKTNALLG